MAWGARGLAVSAALAAAVLVTLAESQTPLERVNPDFIARYAGGEAVADGRSPYDDEAVRRRGSELGPYGLPVYDAPPVLAAFRGLAALPLRAASNALLVLNLAASAAIARVATRRRPWPVWAFATVAVMLSSPARETLRLGQIDLVALALVLLVATWVPAVAIFKPHTAGLVAIGTWARRAWRDRIRMVLLAAAGAVAIVLVSAWVAPSARWSEWWDHLGGRANASAGRPEQRILFAIGLVVLARGWRRCRRRGVAVDEVAVAGAATTLLAVSGNWNTQWFLALCLPLGALLLGVLLDGLPLRRHEALLLILATACVAGGGLVPYNPPVDYEPWVAVAAVGCFLVALVASRRLSWRVAVLFAVLNATFSVVKCSHRERIALAMVVAITLLYLVLELRPRRLPIAVEVSG